jgi:L,D-peptidoglycan transpeptidase YkuD (ErfK/YbiS/YcfS/YnhG family)
MKSITKRFVPFAILFVTGCSIELVPMPADNPSIDPPMGCRQYIDVRAAANDIHATLRVYEERNGKWYVILTVPATVGRKGITTAESKKEGDGCTPAGLFKLERAFGYAEKIETGLTYRQATATDLWVDDPASPDYNLWVKAPTKAKSFEEMRRKDDLYEIGAVIEYNTDPVVAGKGSAIFFHVWGGPDSPTAGCVAVEKEKLRSILKWLDKAKAPHMSIVIIR